MSQIKERPILFSGAMVRALLDGSKTQTRRIIKPQPTQPRQAGYILHATDKKREGGFQWSDADCKNLSEPVHCPYGQPGERLWVRETFSYYLDNSIVYRADPASEKQEIAAAMVGWKPSIHMPRVASRLLLEIVAVRAERLNDISEADAKAEGVNMVNVNSKGGEEWENYLDDWAFEYFAKDSYATLWEKINGLGSWAPNPWVWVVEFKIVQPATCAPLTTPDTSADVLRNDVKIGTVHCINVAPTGPPALKYYGRNLSGSASGQAHATQAQAEQDVADWADGKEVAYLKQAQVPYCNGQCGICSCISSTHNS